MARINSLVCVFALAFLALASTSYGYYDNEEPRPSGTEGQPFKISNYVPRVRVPKVPEVEHPEVPSVPEAEKPYVSTAPKVEKPYVPAVPEAEKPYVPTAPKVEKPYVPTTPKVPTPKNYAVQGLVYCQSGAERIPIEGVVTKVVCFAADLVSQLLVVTSKTDNKGYFYTPLDVSSIIYQVFQCKVYLDTCPMTICSHPTDINNGVTGALLSLNYHSLPNNKNLYSVGPFVYTPEPKY
ncbi:hypothetical protein C5167_044910 [Papaver somniferum]|uniref:Pollen Ole e 1 allergen and extensin family protein n=1 Tax=Papaver somniferum TaxID=3469 RepID=A0A4Y7L9A3_PAPSO|nr:proline-rich protein 3-like [Papaver somniferum]RZC82124.1 hypothetical protein C5167_044910 [Papaver somniferum]